MINYAPLLPNALTHAGYRGVMQTKKNRKKGPIL